MGVAYIDAQIAASASAWALQLAQLHRHAHVHETLLEQLAKLPHDRLIHELRNSYA